MEEEGVERTGRGRINGYSRGYPSGGGCNRVGGGGGSGPAFSRSSPSGGGGQRLPYDNVTSATFFTTFSSKPTIDIIHLHDIFLVLDFLLLDSSIHTYLILIFTSNIGIYHHRRRIFRVILNSNKYHLRYHPIFRLLCLPLLYQFLSTNLCVSYAA